MSGWIIVGLVGLTALSAASAVQAQDAPAVAAAGVDAASPDGVAATPIADADLGAISGGQGVVVEALSNQQLSASNSGSIEANQVSTGNVDFSTGDYSGIGNFVVNTGNNNNLQGVISVNVATLGGP